jgi:hypothetical protein
VGRGADREKLRDPLDNAENNRFKNHYSPFQPNYIVYDFRNDSGI